MQSSRWQRIYDLLKEQKREPGETDKKIMSHDVTLSKPSGTTELQAMAEDRRHLKSCLSLRPPSSLKMRVTICRRGGGIESSIISGEAQLKSRRGGVTISPKGGGISIRKVH